MSRRPDEGDTGGLGRHRRESRGEIEAHLVTEHAQRAGAGAIRLARAVLADVAEEIEILLHCTHHDWRDVSRISYLVLRRTGNALPDRRFLTARYASRFTNDAPYFDTPAR